MVHIKRVKCEPVWKMWEILFIYFSMVHGENVWTHLYGSHNSGSTVFLNQFRIWFFNVNHWTIKMMVHIFNKPWLTTFWLTRKLIVDRIFVFKNQVMIHIFLVNQWAMLPVIDEAPSHLLGYFSNYFNDMFNNRNLSIWYKKE